MKVAIFRSQVDVQPDVADSGPRKPTMPPRPFSSSSSAPLPMHRPAGPRGQGGASSLLRLGASATSLPAPAMFFSQRPSVLTRQRHEPQQLSLFGPPGGHR
jgi:hypothetical protein